MIDRDEILTRLDRFTDNQHQLEEILQTLVLNDSTIIDALAQMLGAIQKMNARAELTQAGVEKTQNQLAAEIRSLAVAIAELQPAPAERSPILAASDTFSAQNPDIALLQFLYSFVEETTAIDVGAHVGEVSERLLQAGYRVHAFEPYPPSFAELHSRLGGNSRFTAFPTAIGPEDGQTVLHVARDVSGSSAQTPSLFNSLVDHPMLRTIQFTERIPVSVRSLASLRAAGEIPACIGVLKIDTEGLDLGVIDGMGASDIPVVMAEFWDGKHPFGLSGHSRLEPTVAAMRTRGYAWHIVIYHLDEEGTISYYLNRVDTMPKSWGNVLFFQERSLFAKAARWCETVLARTLHP